MVSAFFGLSSHNTINALQLFFDDEQRNAEVEKLGKFQSQPLALRLLTIVHERCDVFPSTSRAQQQCFRERTCEMEGSAWSTKLERINQFFGRFILSAVGSPCHCTSALHRSLASISIDSLRYSRLLVCYNISRPLTFLPRTRLKDCSFVGQ